MVGRIPFSVLICVSFAVFQPMRARAANARFSKVMTVIFENESYDEVVGLPFFGKLATEGANLENFHAEAHPSQPNYIALISGDKQGCTNDKDINIDAPNITDLLDRKGKTWKVYVEAYPGNCFKGTKSGTYARKHNPFISFKSIQNSPQKCSHIVAAAELQRDVSAGTLPDYSFYVPDMKNDGHDTDVAYADAWYSRTFGPLIRDGRFMQGMLLVSTFDESRLLTPGNHIYTSLYGEGVKAGSIANQSYDHYSLLRTIEDEFGLGTMASHDKAATAIDGVWTN